MTCDESVDRMSELLDGLPSEALEAHLGGCPSCREGLEAMRRADEALRRYPSVEWRPAMTESILRRAKRPVRPLLALAAAGLLAVGVGGFLLLRRESVLPIEPLARHVAAVRCMAEQEGYLDRDVLSSQVRLLGLRDLTARISADSDGAMVRDYVRHASSAIESPEDVQRLWGHAREVRDSCSLPDLRCRIEPVVDPVAADLYGAGLLHFANGEPAEGVRALDRLVDVHPPSAYADASCVALARHFAKTGDDVSALAFYASIRKPATITPEIARAIQESGRRAGRAFAGTRPMAEADLETLRRCAETGTPYGLVRTSPAEILLLGPVRGLGPPRDVFSCASLATRRARIEPGASPADPVLREMLGAMNRLAK